MAWAASYDGSVVSAGGVHMAAGYGLVACGSPGCDDGYEDVAEPALGSGCLSSGAHGDVSG